jgi:hypothetical protein
MTDRLEHLQSREAAWEQALAHVYTAQKSLLDAYLAIKELPFAADAKGICDTSRNAVRMMERAVALELHDVRREIANLTPRDPRLVEQGWFVEACEQISGAVDKLAMHGFTGQVNVGRANLTVRL